MLLHSPSHIMGSMVNTWPGFITPTALFSGEKQNETANVHSVIQGNGANFPDIPNMALLTGVMWHIGGSVEKPVDAVTTVAPHHRETVGLSVLLDDVP